MKFIFLVIMLFSFSSFAEYLFVEGGSSAARSWTKYSKNDRLNLKNILQTLAMARSGRKLIQMANSKAKSQGMTLYDIIQAGKGSLTDTTLVRKFNRVHFDKITYQVNSKVYINRDLGHHDAVLDLAHELTHFVYRDEFNPYVKNFSLQDFIKRTIEGKGGEVQAFMMECQVQSELFQNSVDSRFNCKKIMKNGKLSFDLAKVHFYHVGHYFDSFKELLQKRNLLQMFPDLSEKKESFVSGVYGIPYPVAAFEEYLSVLNKACENDRRRILMMKEEKRVPASVVALEKSYQMRCSDYIN